MDRIYKDLLDIDQYSASNIDFNIGDKVRSYGIGFNNEKPYKHSFIEGVVVGLESWVKSNDRLIVKWHTNYNFGILGSCIPAGDGNASDTWIISKKCPFLVKVNGDQLALPL
jgi:hypothetical protein